MRTEKDATSFTKIDATDKRSAILRATLDLIVERGFHDTPMSLIAKKAGVSAGIIYYYFKSKDDLIYELYKDIKLKLLSAVLKDYPAQASYRERFLAFWKQALRHLIDHPKETMFLEQFENSPYSQLDWHELIADEFKASTDFFWEGIREGVLKDMPIEVSIGMSVGLALMLAKQHIQGKLQLTDELIDLAANASWDAVRK